MNVRPLVKFSHKISPLRIRYSSHKFLESNANDSVECFSMATPTVCAFFFDYYYSSSFSFFIFFHFLSFFFIFIYQQQTVGVIIFSLTQKYCRSYIGLSCLQARNDCQAPTISLIRCEKINFYL